MAATAIAACATESAFAQNASLYYSDDAALFAGAAIALPGDPGATYYNPAGLGALDRARVSVSGSIFGLRIREIDDAFTLETGAAKSSLGFDSTDFISAPTAVGAAFELHPKVSVGVGLYTSERDVQAAEDEAVGVDLGDGATTLTQRIDLQYDATKYHFGGSVGFALSDTVRLGVGLFGVYWTNNAYVQLAFGVEGADALAAFQTVTARLASTVWGMQPIIGLQWDISPRVHVALSARAPEFRIASSSETTSLITGASNFPGGETISFALGHDDVEGDGLELLAPARFAIGAMFMPTPLVKIAIEAEIATPMRSEELGLERNFVANGRIGTRFQVSKELILGAGIFTDLANAPLDEELAARRVHNIGTTFGGTLLTPLSVGGESNPTALILTTTLAATYTIGFGEARTLNYDGATLRPGTTDVLFHEIMPYTGSSILF